MIDEGLGGDLSELRCFVEVQRVFAFYRHYITLAHFKLYIPLAGVMLDYISLIEPKILRAMAVRFDIFDNP
jgi:hypothetical protein